MVRDRLGLIHSGVSQLTCQLVEIRSIEEPTVSRRALDGTRLRRQTL